MTTAIATTFQFDYSRYSARLAVGLLGALVVTAWLFWLMQYLIENSDQKLNESTTTATLEFVRLKREEVIERKERTLEPPPVVEPPPSTPRFDDFDTDTTTKIAVPAPPVDLRPGPGNDGPGLGFSDGDYLPFVKVAPIYPRRLLSRGIEGECTVEFTVTAMGTVRDPRVVDGQCSNSQFVNVSLDAVMKFKYKPRVIDGVAVAVNGVRNRFTFEITE